MSESSKILAIVSVVGQDQKGVVARVSTCLAERAVNIEDIEQRVLQGLFIMNMLVDMSDVDVTLDELIADLTEHGNNIGMQIEVRLLSRRRERPYAVLVSKEPHCLERILLDVQEGAIPAPPAVVFSNHEVLRPLAEEAGIAFEHFPQKDRDERDRAMVEALARYQPDLVVLARYMQILTPAFVDAYPSRIINIHPSLLPFHPGANAYKQAFEHGNRVAGCTAHFVTEDLDEGPIILQDVFHIAVGQDTLDEIKRKGRELEAKVLSKAIQLYLNSELLVKDQKVVYKPGLDFFRKHHSL